MSANNVPLLQTQPASLQQLRKFAAGGYLYALLDAYNAPFVSTKVQELGSEKAGSLFVGEAETKYWDLAPYLIAIEESSLDWVLQTICSSPCGILAFSKSDLETLRTHFRRFLLVQLPDGERWYFRYYDPRILRVYLQNCRPEELVVFFGPVRGFGIADLETQDIVLLHMDGDQGSISESQIYYAPVWQVRPEQYKALGGSAQRDFERRLWQHVTHQFPQKCAELGENRALELIQHGLKMAAAYQFYREADLAGFVELMFVLGWNFDRDPELPQVSALLQDPTIVDPAAKLSRIADFVREMQGSAPATGADSSS
jgi:hypothetical protein